MSEGDPKLPGKKSGFVTGFLKFLFFFIAMVAVLLTVLFNMGGTSDTLKSSLEKYISDTMGGRPTFIAKLNRISFFPVIGADFDELTVKETPQSEEMSLSISKFKAFVTFWGVVTKKTQIKSLYIEGLSLRGGVVGKRDFTIKRLFIDHDKGTRQAAISAEGTLADFPWNFRLGLDVSGSIGGFSYSLGKNRPIKFDLDQVHLDANINEQINDFIKVDSLSVGMPENVVNGTLSLSLLEGKQIKINGRLEGGEPKTVIKPDLILDYSSQPAKVTGTITSPVISPQGLKGDNSPTALFNLIHQKLIVQTDETDKSKESESGDQEQQGPARAQTSYMCAYDFDIRFSAENVATPDQMEGGALEFQAKNAGQHLTVTPLKGDVTAYDGPCEAQEFFKPKS
ncbi:MAG: hypothetical protein H6858_02340 [Rhodospirillales bacterium]|nr:hypothetical protein [Alphaproteobacteria bacterium]MCB9976423.1 hypothetical protein [Rhodospirillales bacterium]